VTSHVAATSYPHFRAFAADAPGTVDFRPAAQRIFTGGLQNRGAAEREGCRKGDLQKPLETLADFLTGHILAAAERCVTAFDCGHKARHFVKILRENILYQIVTFSATRKVAASAPRATAKAVTGASVGSSVANRSGPLPISQVAMNKHAHRNHRKLPGVC
jgi:hypothetical protein